MDRLSRVKYSGDCYDEIVGGGVLDAPQRADMESAPTTARETAYDPRGGGFYIRPRDRLAGKTMPASQQSWPVRAVQSPTGALIAARPRNASIDPYRTAMHVASLHLLWCNLVPAASNSRQDAKNSGVIVSPGATSGTPGG